MHTKGSTRISRPWDFEFGDHVEVIFEPGVAGHVVDRTNFMYPDGAYCIKADIADGESGVRWLNTAELQLAN